MSGGYLADPEHAEIRWFAAFALPQQEGYISYLPDAMALPFSAAAPTR